MHSVASRPFLSHFRKIASFTCPFFCTRMDNEDDFSLYSSHSVLKTILQDTPKNGVEKYLAQIKLAPIPDFAKGESTITILRIFNEFL